MSDLPSLPTIIAPPNTTISDDPNFVPKGAKVGDILIARYETSEWAMPWDDWHHAAIVVNLDPLEIVEVSGVHKPEYPSEKPGPQRKLFAEAPMWGKAHEWDPLVKIKWIRPVFPNPIREIDKKEVPRSERKIISEDEARKRAVDYALAQEGEPYKLSADPRDLWQMRAGSVDLLANDVATKWDENEWYCGLLVFKAYSRTVTDMYLENYTYEQVAFDPDGYVEMLSPGFFVTPEDILESKRSEPYYTWISKSYYEQQKSAGEQI